VIKLVTNEKLINDAASFSQTKEYDKLKESYYNSLKAMLRTLAEEKVKKYTDKLNETNRIEQTHINELNVQMQRVYEKSKGGLQKDKNEKFNSILNNLKPDSKYTGLDEYIDNKCQTSSAAAFKTLYNICKTNMYKDAFYNIQKMGLL
jgi:hypothetical protein